MGEWSSKYGSGATRKKVYVARGIKYFSGIGVAEFEMESGSLRVGDEILVTGPTTGAVMQTVDEIRVDLKPVEETVKGERFSIKMSEKIRPSDRLYKNGESTNRKRTTIMKEYIFKLTDKVRDYECDLQGVVNNSNYQHYMEHTRHEFLESLGENFGAMHEKGIDAFVARVDIQFKNSLRSGDRYTSCLNVYKKGVKLVFEQDIYRESDGALATKGVVESVVVENGKLTRGEYFDEMLKRIESKQA